MSEKPLHVQVAEALEVKPDFRYSPSEDFCWTYCSCGASREMGHGWEESNDSAWYKEHQPHLELNWNCPRYDKDWAVTGPLVEKCKIYMEPHQMHWEVEVAGGPRVGGLTLLEAVCHLIVELGKEGKL